MKAVVLLSFSLLIYFVYQTVFDNETSALTDEELETALASGSAEGKKLKESFKRLLPELKQAQIIRLRNSKNNGPSLPAETTGHEAVERMQAEFKADPERGSHYLHWTLFESNLPLEAKEEVLFSLKNFVPPTLLQQLMRDMLNRQVDPALYDEALKVFLESQPEKEVEFFLQELGSRTPPGPHLDILRQEASSRNISMP